MRKNFMRVTLFVLCFIMVFSVFNCVPMVGAANESDLQSDIAELQAESKKLEAQISKLKSEKADQKAIVDALQNKISNTQAQIRRCNEEISSINSAIAKNKSEIDKQNKEIEATKLTFKKRLRAIYMTNTQSNINILLGAESFSDYLQLAQLTGSISAHDKKIMEDIVAVIDVLNKKNDENKKLLEKQTATKNDILKIQSQLESEEREAEGIYNSLSSEQSGMESENAQIEKLIKSKEKELNAILYSSSGQNFINSKSGFVWPVPSCRSISSSFGWRTHPITGRSKLHAGIDIAGAGIYGKPIVAITDGTVYKTYTSCPHRAKSPICGCGGGYGNYVAVDHGTVKGERIKAYYAHMDSVAVPNGASVKQGQVLGYVGTTGSSTGYHLHFGIMKNDSWVNPMNYYSSTK